MTDLQNQLGPSKDALDERSAIISWLHHCELIHHIHAKDRGQVTARRHHIDACRNIAAAIARGEHLMDGVCRQLDV